MKNKMLKKVVAGSVAFSLCFSSLVGSTAQAKIYSNSGMIDILRDAISTRYTMPAAAEISNLTVGTRVKYIPSGSEIVLSNETGVESQQVINPSDKTDWIVFNIDGDKVELINAGSVGNLSLKGRVGYENASSVFNRISKEFGENARVAKEEDISKIITKDFSSIWLNNYNEGSSGIWDFCSISSLISAGEIDQAKVYAKSKLGTVQETAFEKELKVIVTLNANDFEIVNGDGTIENPFEIEIGSTLPTVTGIIGDVDLDGEVTLFDGIKISRHAEGLEELTEEEKKLADVNKDGKVDAFDSKLIFAYVAGNIDTLPLEIKLGDVNCDGIIGTFDAVKTLQYIEGVNKLDNKQKLCADVNMDDVIDELDAKLILAYVAGIDVDKKGSVADVVEGNKIGDVNGDGEITLADGVKILQYIEGEINLPEEKLKCADVNGDGEITEEDAKCILSYTLKESKSLETIGDVNKDGNINLYDSSAILQYVSGEKELTEEEKKLADVNKDGKVDAFDSKLILAYVAGKIDTLPLEIKLGDVDCDGNIGTFDSVKILQYIEGVNELDNKQRLCADVNMDDVIDKFDAKLILNYIVNIDALPLEIKLGDVNNDGEVDVGDAILILRYKEGLIKFNENQKLCADVNFDDKVNKEDAIIIMAMDAGIDVSKKDNIAKLVEGNKIGDVDGDDEVTAADGIAVMDYIAGEAILSEESLKRADVNEDGEVNKEDAECILAYALEEVEKLSETIGDINCDGSIDSEDVSILSAYLDGTKELTEKEKDYADINRDETVTKFDLRILEAAVEKKIEEIPLEIKLGDVNNDGEVNIGDVVLIRRYEANLVELTEEQKLCADFNEDGNIDATDYEMIRRLDVELPYLVGDVNVDGEITLADAVIIEQYVEGIRELIKEEKEFADVNKDGEVTKFDAELILAYIVKNVDTLPLEVKLGDVTRDGEVNYDDVIMILGYIEGNKELDKVQKICADMNFDGEITEEDSNIVLKMGAGFADVNKGDWYYDSGVVEYATTNGYMNGLNEIEFGPDVPMTFAMLREVNNIDGIISMIGDNEGDECVSRSKILEILYTYAINKGYDVSTEGNEYLSFNDSEEVDKMSTDAKNAINWAIKVGVIYGDKNEVTGKINVLPAKSVTRAQFAAMLKNFNTKMIAE